MDDSAIESYKKDLIKQINKYRNEHGADKLTNENKIDKIAQKFAEKLAKKGELDYSYNQFNGEDLGESVYQSEIYFAPLKLAKTLYDENIEYNYKSKDPEPSNFTQMVWKNSELIGFGMQKNSEGNYFYVINYYPIGNIDGQFKKNVFPPGTKVSEKPNKKNIYEDNDDFTKYNKKDDDFNEYESKKNKKKEKDKDNDKNKNKKKEDKNSTLDILSQLINNKKKEKDNNIIYEEKKEVKYESPPSSNRFDEDEEYDDFCLEALNAHNKYRKIHHVDPLKLNKEICDIAEKYSKQLTKIGHLQHSDNCYKEDMLGENLFYCSGVEVTGTLVTKNWYGENKSHNYSGDYKTGTGHFTQMIWKETKEVGFGKHKDKKGRTYVVANYYPCGNIIGFFKYNVFEP